MSARIFLLLCGALMLSARPAAEWGFHGHRQINKLAVFSLPGDMFGYYKRHIDFISAHAVDPDKRRYGVKGEAERHFIDIDHYCHFSDSAVCNPFAVVPRRWDRALEKFGEDTLRAYGIVPWHVDKMVWQLTEAFKSGNHKRILRLSAELGHYVGDACVPLHTTENYNGQMTGQKGIHGFWESRLPELYDTDYDFFTGKAKHVSRPLDYIWDRVEESHLAVDSVLGIERDLSTEWPKDKKYGYEERGQALVRTYSEAYSREYHKRLNGQVERRMRTAVIAIGSLWYTAWVNAGQPNMDLIDSEIDLEIFEEELSKENGLPEKEELKKRIHE